MFRQEEEDEQAEAAGTGEDLCHLSAYNKETASAVSLIVINVCRIFVIRAGGVVLPIFDMLDSFSATRDH